MIDNFLSPRFQLIFSRYFTGVFIIRHERVRGIHFNVEGRSYTDDKTFVTHKMGFLFSVGWGETYGRLGH